MPLMQPSTMGTNQGAPRYGCAPLPCHPAPGQPELFQLLLLLMPRQSCDGRMGSCHLPLCGQGPQCRSLIFFQLTPRLPCPPAAGQSSLFRCFFPIYHCGAASHWNANGPSAIHRLASEYRSAGVVPTATLVAISVPALAVPPTVALPVLASDNAPTAPAVRPSSATPITRFVRLPSYRRGAKLRLGSRCHVTSYRYGHSNGHRFASHRRSRHHHERCHGPNATPGVCHR